MPSDNNPVSGDPMGDRAYDLKTLLTRFFTSPWQIDDPLGEVVSAYSLERLEEFDEVQSLLPVGRVPNVLVDGCYTEIDEAPFLFATKAGANMVQRQGAPPEATLIALTRRCAMLNTDERDMFEWIADLSSVDPIKKDEDGGNHSWTYTLSPSVPVIDDRYRLFVAKTEGMLVLDRICVFKAAN